MASICSHDGRKTVCPTIFALKVSYLILISRIDIQQCVRRLGSQAQDAEQQKVQNLRDAVAPLLIELRRLEIAAGAFQSARPSSEEPDDAMVDWVDDFDLVSESAPALHPDLTSPEDVLPIECQRLSLPSNGDFGQLYDSTELSLRRNQAMIHLNQLQELIAKKSFQYSDVIWTAPRKSFCNHARAAVKDLNIQISFHCQVYSQCCSRLVRLGADQATLQQFQVLKKDDIKLSTAILTPNTPGATSIKLSWIWHAVTRRILPAADADADADGDQAHTNPATILECK